MMLFENVLTEADKNLIEAWITDYATEDVNSSSSRAPLSTILRYWDCNKENLFKMFGGNLILSKQIMFAKAEEDIEREIEDSLYSYEPGSMRTFSKNFSNYVDEHYEEMDCCRWTIMDLFGVYCLIKNQWTGDSFSVKIPNGKTVQIQKGCKPMKILGKLAKAFGIEGFEEFRLAHSRILNQKTMKGQLCLSIHPMDYMTMSDNDCDWDSCMSWRNNGCYCRGTVEMMNSNCVVVAYLKSSEDMRFYDKYWNNKKWRQLFVVTPECIAGVKGYPYCHDTLAETCINWLADLSAANLNIEYKPTVYTMEHGRTFSVDGEDWRFNFHTNTMYNDFGSCPHKIRVAMEPPMEYHNHDIYYSGEEVCMWCGCGDGYYDGEGSLTCSDCSEYVRCACCEERISLDDVIEVDGEYYCRYCYDDHIMTCSISHKAHYESSMAELYLVPDDFPEDNISTYRCDYSTTVSMNDILYGISDDCFTTHFNMKSGSRSDNFHHFGCYWNNYYYIRFSDVTEQGQRLFGLYNDDDIKEFFQRHEF